MKGFKEYRNMTVSEMSGYRYKPTPAIRLSGYTAGLGASDRRYVISRVTTDGSRREGLRRAGDD